MNPKREQALAKAAKLLHDAGWYFHDIGLVVGAVMVEHLSYEEGYRASVRRPREVLEAEGTKIGFDDSLRD